MILNGEEELKKQFQKIKNEQDLTDREFDEILNDIEMITQDETETIWKDEKLIPPSPYGTDWKEKLQREKDLK